MVAREPNGKPQRTHGQSEISPTEVRRLRDAAINGLRSDEWGSELGRYYLCGHITDQMYAAGKYWAMLAARYHQAIGAKPHEKALALERGSRGSAPDPDSDRGQAIAKGERKHVNKFLDVLTALEHAGPQATRLVRALCEYNQSPATYGEFLLIRAGLALIAREQDQKSNTRSKY